MKRKRTKKEDRKVKELKEQLARALADYDNLRKRVEREREEIVKLASVSFFVKLMPVFDVLSRAQEHLKDKGLTNVLEELKRVLESENIVKIEVKKGDTFDEVFHEVLEIAEAKDKKKKGKIAEVILAGWMIKDGPVIRPTKVKVYGEKVEKKEKLEKEVARGEYV